LLLSLGLCARSWSCSDVAPRSNSFLPDACSSFFSCFDPASTTVLSSIHRHFSHLFPLNCLAPREFFPPAAREIHRDSSHLGSRQATPIEPNLALTHRAAPRSRHEKMKSGKRRGQHTCCLAYHLPNQSCCPCYCCYCCARPNTGSVLSLGCKRRATNHKQRSPRARRLD
jgi:hypothetical protein